MKYKKVKCKGAIGASAVSIKDIPYVKDNLTIRAPGGNILEFDFDGGEFTLQMSGGKIVISRQKHHSYFDVDREYLLQDKKGRVFWGKDPHVTSVTQAVLKKRKRKRVYHLCAPGEKPKFSYEKLPKKLKVDYFYIPVGALHD